MRREGAERDSLRRSSSDGASCRAMIKRDRVSRLSREADDFRKSERENRDTASSGWIGENLKKDQESTTADWMASEY